jgi:hypothetical protein
MDEISTLIVFIVIVVFFLLVVLIIAENSELFIEYRNSKLNNNSYGVQEIFNKSDDAVELLAKLHNHMNDFVTDLENNYPSDDRVKRLTKGFRRAKIEEAPNDDGSSYTINKGDLVALCLRHKEKDHPFHDYNTLLFVVIHEMAHIASISEGHNTEFITNFKWLLQEAKKFGHYEPVNYQKSPMTYCGVKVTNNPYYS